GARLRGQAPKTPRYPSVSVIAPRCIWADALTKVVTLAGIESPITIKALSLYHAQAVVS
ncbi:thiamine biosynthesis protein ApbE, partial [Cupriavidus pinatubonensis]